MTFSTYLHSGMTAHEAEIMRRWDAGERRAAIAADLGLSIRTVESTVSMFTGDDRRHREEANRLASQRLGAACAALRGRVSA